MRFYRKVQRTDHIYSYLTDFNQGAEHRTIFIFNRSHGRNFRVRVGGKLNLSRKIKMWLKPKIIELLFDSCLKATGILGTSLRKTG